VPNTEEAAARLIEVVAEKTGYPATMLSLDMALEADLGIDSIKRVEILSALQQRLPGLPPVDATAMASLKTLGQIITAMGGSAAANGPQSGAAAVTQTVDAAARLLEIVSEKTGYPAAMLSLDMALEADLGIDSIKRVEILAAMQQRCPDLPPVDATAMAALKTLGQIVTAMNGAAPSGGDSNPTAGTTPAGQAAAGARPSDASTASAALDRFRVVEVAAPPTAARRAIAGPLVVTPDGRGISTELVAVLRKRGVDAIEVSDVPPTARGVVYLGGLRRMDDIDAALAVNEEAFRAARTAAAAIENGGLFVTVQDTGGNFGLDGHDPVRAWSAGLAGLARTAALEWPLAQAKAIDLECNGRSIRQLALVLADELQSASPAVDVGLHADGLRTTLEAVPSPLVSGESSITPQSVLLVSGGARGVTASAMVELARASHPRLALLGRTPLVDEPAATTAAKTDAEIKQALLAAAQSSGTKVTPQELGARALEILAVREIRATLRAIEDAGASVRYYAADVLDPSALAAVLKDVRSAFGPVTAVIHGAGVLADKKIADKTVAQFRRVFETKVLGLRALLEATESDPIDTIVLFSSVAARTGNFGQCDYAMANEILNKVAAAESRTRGTCRVRAIGWGPWAGGMVTPALEQHFRERGVPVIQRPQGVRHFVAELSHARPNECEVVVGGMLVGVASV
jgi:acyl carrier protein/NADP-dependent 3-hydroxy acid dehydrogenase YdfG